MFDNIHTYSDSLSPGEGSSRVGIGKLEWLGCGFHKVKLFEIYCRYVTF